MGAGDRRFGGSSNGQLGSRGLGSRGGCNSVSDVSVDFRDFLLDGPTGSSIAAIEEPAPSRCAGATPACLSLGLRLVTRIAEHVSAHAPCGLLRSSAVADRLFLHGRLPARALMRRRNAAWRLTRSVPDELPKSHACAVPMRSSGVRDRLPDLLGGHACRSTGLAMIQRVRRCLLAIGLHLHLQWCPRLRSAAPVWH